MKRLALCCLVIALASGALQAQVPDPDESVADARDLFLGGDHAGGLAVLIPAAEAGHPRALNIVASAYQYGLGLPVDAAAAISHFEQAAAQGYPPALHNLGVLLRDGMPGQAPDLVAARDWFRRGAALDYPSAISSFAVMLFNGEGGLADPDNARRMFDRAAELGDPFAHDWLGYLHRTGQGGYPADLGLARDHYTIAALHDLPWAQNALGELLERGEGGAVDLDGAMTWYQRAVAGDEVYAGINAAWLIFDHPEQFPDQVTGLGYCYWAAAASSGDEQAGYRAACDAAAAVFTPAQIRAAEKVAAGL